MTSISDFLKWNWDGDYRTSNWFLMSNPLPTIAISATYLLLVRYGVTLMRHREAFTLRSPILVYNSFVVAVNLMVFIDAGRFGWFNHYNWNCAECDMKDNWMNRGMAATAWFFYITKFLELSDTMFFVLRKKNNLLTKLHLIHHSLLPISCWFTVKYIPVGQASFMGLANSFTHIIMYSHYSATLMGFKNNLIKRTVTKIQMVQFVAMFVHSFQPLFMPSCNFPSWAAYSNAGHAVLFMVLFADFYLEQYGKNKKEKELRLRTKFDVSQLEAPIQSPPC